jgi:hypothetical protein
LHDDRTVLDGRRSGALDRCGGVLAVVGIGRREVGFQRVIQEIGLRMWREVLSQTYRESHLNERLILICLQNSLCNALTISVIVLA